MKVPNIRFNLKFFDEKGGEVAVRTIEDLKQNLNASDLYAYMMDGTLTRWLRSLHGNNFADCVEEACKKEDLRSRVSGMLTAFDIEIDPMDMEAIVASLGHKDLHYEHAERDSIVREATIEDKYVQALMDQKEYEQRIQALLGSDGIGVYPLVHRLMQLDRCRFLAEVKSIPDTRVKYLSYLATLKEPLKRWEVMKYHFTIYYGRDMFGHTGPFVAVTERDGDGHIYSNGEITSYIGDANVLSLIMEVVPYGNGSSAVVFDGKYPRIDEAFAKLVS